MTQPLTDAINALTRYANEVTGQSDTNLSDAVRTLCDGYGGGGGGVLSLIDTIEVSEASRSINVPLQPYQDYDVVVFCIEYELSQADWVYVTINTTTPSVPSWQWLGIEREGWQSNKAMFAIYVNNKNNYSGRILTRYLAHTFNDNNPTNIFLNTYEASVNFNVGSQIRIYGAKYADM